MAWVACSLSGRLVPNLTPPACSHGSLCISSAHWTVFACTCPSLTLDCVFPESRDEAVSTIISLGPSTAQSRA